MKSEQIIFIIQALVPIISIILTAVIVPFIKSKTNAAQREDIEFWITKAVQAAEQIYKTPEMGELRKEFVIKYLAARNIDISAEDVNILIESAVMELFNMGKKIVTEINTSTPTEQIKTETKLNITAE